MIYRWKWDNEKTAAQRAQYGRDGCTRWYPGFNFVAAWTYGNDPDPGRAGFIKRHKATFENDTNARDTRHHNLMIGLMADDIELTPGYNFHAARVPDGMIENEMFRSCITKRHIDLFGVANPTDDVMYTKRGTLAAEVTKP
eukprot:14868060-Heterocapsa_arctica.AAC.1